MADLGRWTGGSATQPTTSWASPNGLGTTQQRNDGSAYSWSSANARLTLPSSNLADGYLMVAHVEFTTTHNNRYTMQGRFTVDSTQGNFLSSTTGGYSRNSANNSNRLLVWAVVDGPGASDTFDLELKRDDGDGTVAGSFTNFVVEVIPLFYSDIAMYSSNSTSLLGGVTPNTLPLTTTVLEGTNITRSGNVITVSGDNKRYFVLGSNYTEGRSGRTQRWIGGEYDATQDRGAMACIYHRDAGTDENGIAFTDLIETNTANRTIEQFVYRGDGIANNQGGADSDGSTPAVGTHAMCVIELNDDCEVIRSSNAGAAAQAITTGTVDISAVESVDFNDAASFTKVSATAINCEVAMDLLAGANIGAAYNTVSSGTRFEGWARFTVNGTEDADTFHGNYGRGNQSSVDTFGYSANPLSFVAVTADQDLGVSHTVTGNTGPVSVQPAWAGMWAINLDTMEPAGGETASGAATIPAVTASGAATVRKQASGAATIAAVVAAGAATVVNVASDGAPSIAPIEAAGNATVTVVRTASGDPSIPAIEASGTALVRKQASGTPAIPAIEAAGNADVTGVINASGTPSIPVVTASGQATVVRFASDGTPVLAPVEASGNATVRKTASDGSPQTPVVEASGAATVARQASGSPSIPAIEASGTANTGSTKVASGTPSIPAIDASGNVDLTRNASGAATIAPVEASGAATIVKDATGAASIPVIEAAGAATVVRIASDGAPSIPAIEASGTASTGKIASGNPSTPVVEGAGTALVRRQASGAPSIPAIIASGEAKVPFLASGAATIPAIVAAGTVKLIITADGTPSTPVVEASGAATVTRSASGAATLAPIEASGNATANIKNASGNPSIPVIEAAGVAVVRNIASGAATTPVIEASGAATTIKVASGTPTTPVIEASGVAQVTKFASGAATIPAIEANGVCIVGGTPVFNITELTGYFIDWCAVGYHLPEITLIGYQINED